MKNHEISHRDYMAFNVAYCRSSVRNNGAIIATFYGLMYILFRFVSQRRANSRTNCRSAKIKEYCLINIVCNV